MTPAPPAPRVRETLLAALLLLALTVLMTWPQAAHMGDALSDFGDAKLNARILQWDFAQTLRGPGRLFQLDFFHPARYVLAFSENLYGVALFGFPVLAAGGSAVLNYNVLLLLGMFLSALGAWALARHVTSDPIAAVAAGMVYAFLPWRIEQIPHLQHQWGGFLCLILLFLLRYLESGRRRDLVLFGAAFAWNALANVHFALFSGFLVAVTLAWFALRRAPERRPRIGRAIAAAAIGSLPFLPFAAGYAKASKLHGLRRYTSELETYSGRWTDFLSAASNNHFWGPRTERWAAAEGHFFPGVLAVVLAGIAIAALWRRRSGSAALPETARTPGRRAALAVRAADVLIAALAALYIGAKLVPNLELGPLRLGDPGRVLVFLAIAVVARLSAAFPGRRFRDLGGFLRSLGLDPRAALLLAIAACGILVALGYHTPFYRFLFQSFGPVFRVIRAPARGIVLFDLALAVLAAWGLSILVRGRSTRERAALTAVAMAILVFEYRAFPLPLFPTPGAPAPVYAWIRETRFPGAVVEWPLGLTYDFEYVLRQAAHQKPLVNGYSGFFPRAYVELETALKRRPIPREVWGMLPGVEAGLLVYHAHEGRGYRAVDYAYAVRRAAAAGTVELLGSFPHGDEGLDFVYRPASAPAWSAPLGPAGTPPPEAARLFESAIAALEKSQVRAAPPFGVIHFPEEGQRVAPGFWVFGWALDDSGIAAVRVGTELGDSGAGQVGATWPGLADVFPDYREPGNGAYGVPLPDVAPGPHTLRITLVARDGGETVLERPIVVIPARVSPTPRGPGSPRSSGARGPEGGKLRSRPSRGTGGSETSIAR